MNKPKVIAVIPARYKSSRFYGKPLADIGGKPMIFYTHRQTLQAKLVDEVVVATDDKRIQAAVMEFGGRVIMTSEHHKTGTDRVGEVALRLDGDIFVNVQGDELGVHPDSIDALITPLLEQPDLYVTNLMSRIEKMTELIDANVVKVANDVNDFFMFLTRSPIPYPKTTPNYQPYRQLGVYAFRREFLLKFTKMAQTPLELTEGIEFMRILENGYRVKGVLSPYDSFDVNTPEDLVIAKKRLISDSK